KFVRLGTKRAKVFEEDVLRVYRQTDKSIKVFETIVHVICLPVAEIMLLLESSMEVAHKIYMDNTKLQGRSDAKAGINSKATKSHHRPNKARKG
ncbi:609_t:CDS:2, partial [Rhizophagus irregularis]